MSSQGEKGLIHDRRGDGPPGLHALVVGVSGYDHLRNADPPKPRFQDLAPKLDQLSGPARSASDLARFLIARHDRWIRPLKTCRLLVSPARDGSDEPPVADAGPLLPGWRRAAYADLVSALQSWQDDVNADPDGAALFYFAGHGIQRSPGDAILLPADFLGGNTLLDRAVDVNQIYNGMARSRLFKEMSLNQFYFIDACQADLEIFREFPFTDTPPIFEKPNSGADDRVAPIYYAAAPGHETFAVRGKGTLFGRDLLRCLEGGAGKNVAENGFDEEWAVTIASLSEALEELLHHYNKQRGFKVRTSRTEKFTDTRTVLHRLDGPPEVDCVLRIDPEAACASAGVCFGVPPAEWEQPLIDLKNPHKFQRKAGFYMYRTSPQKPFLELKPGTVFVKPPLTNLHLRFKS